MASSLPIRVNVVYSPCARGVHEASMELTAPTTVMQAILQSGLAQRFPEINTMPINVGVWGRKVPVEQLLRDQDRVEVYRPLRIDPKLARRERFARQGVRGTGLFAKKRIKPAPPCS